MAREKGVKPKGSALQDFYTKLKGADKELVESCYSDPTVILPRLSTGYHILDGMIDGGMRAGSYVELFGAESVGKTTLALHMMKQCQTLWDRPVAFFDFEHTWSYERAVQLGIDIAPDSFHLWEPPTQEEGYDLIDVSLKYRDENNNLPPYGLIVVDSLSAMPVMYEQKEKMEKSTVAYQARNNSKAFRKMTAALGDVIVIFINQIRDNMSPYGARTVTSGGRALKHYTHHRIELRKEFIVGEKQVWDADKFDYVTADKEKVGHIVRFHLHKNKMGVPERHCKMVFDYDKATFDWVEDVRQYLGQHGLIWQHSSAYWGIKGLDKKIQGKKRLHDYIEGNPEHIAALVAEAEEMDKAA